MDELGNTKGPDFFSFIICFWTRTTTTATAWCKKSLWKSAPSVAERQQHSSQPLLILMDRVDIFIQKRREKRRRRREWTRTQEEKEEEELLSVPTTTRQLHQRIMCRRKKKTPIIILNLLGAYLRPLYSTNWEPSRTNNSLALKMTFAHIHLERARASTWKTIKSEFDHEDATAGRPARSLRINR